MNLLKLAWKAQTCVGAFSVSVNQVRSNQDRRGRGRAKVEVWFWGKNK